MSQKTWIASNGTPQAFPGGEVLLIPHEPVSGAILLTKTRGHSLKQAKRGGNFILMGHLGFRIEQEGEVTDLELRHDRAMVELNAFVASD